MEVSGWHGTGANAKDTTDLVCHYCRFSSLEIQNLSCIMYIHTKSGNIFQNHRTYSQEQQFFIWESRLCVGAVDSVTLYTVQ